MQADGSKKMLNVFDKHHGPSQVCMNLGMERIQLMKLMVLFTICF